MSDELLMDLADCGSPEALIGVILKHHPAWCPPVPIVDFARTVNIADIKEHESDAFEGALMTDQNKTKGVILHRAGRMEGRKRFTIAHEIGHFLLPSHTGNRKCTLADMSERRVDTLYRRQEAEANRFSAGILMPAPWFKRDMDRLGDADVTHVQTLAGSYKTSLEATANRYIGLTPDSCAFVFSKDGVVRYVRKTEDFPRLAVKSKEPLPSDCSSRRAPAEPLRVATGWDEVDSELWLHEPKGKARLRSILEQSVRQKGGHQVTLLFMSAEQVSEDEEDEELSDSWQPKFRR